MASDATKASHANALAFRLKLLVSAGLAPSLGACASCGSPEHLVGYSPQDGGVVCNACEAASFPIALETHEFMTGALASSLAQTPAASARCYRAPCGCSC